jgi:eukaryotic-like serine/threonine-protein kinase
MTPTEPANPASALGTSEQRLTSVVVARGAPGAPRTHAMERARAACVPFGARAEQQADGLLVVTLSGRGSARDQARQAARCALAIRDVLGEDSLAVATGRAGADAEGGTRAVVEQAAAILAPHAPVGDGPRRARPIAIDATTAGLLGARFEVVAGEAHATLRRERDPADTEAPRTLLGAPAPFVGRERELATLEAILRATVEDRTAQAVLVTGASGIGKSRLLGELLRRACPDDDLVDVWVARGDPIGAGSPLAMLAQLVRAAAGVQARETLRARQEKILAMASRHFAGAEQTRVAEFLGELAGIRFPEAKSEALRAARRSPTLLGDQMRRAWEDFLAAECAARPVLLVLEDLHWGDLPTVHFVDGALRHLSDRPLMVLGIGQPDVNRLFPNLWASHTLTSLRIGELSRKASERLVRQVVGDRASEEAVARIVVQAGGNAFYLEELIRAHVDGERELPGTVLAMVEARLAALDPSARRVLRAASVFGGTFWKAGVSALLATSVPEHQVGAMLGELEHAELVARTEPGRFADEMIFRHALVRDTAYATLTEADRALGHRLAGRWLESAGETDSMALGQQFERGGEPELAIACYERAVEQALGGNDYATAIARAGQAMACGAQGRQRGNLLALQAEGHRWMGDFDATARCLEEAVPLLAPGEARWFTVVSELLAARVRTGQVAGLESLVGELADTEPHPGAGPAQVVAWARAAVSLVFVGSSELAARLFERLEGANVSSDEPAVIGRVEQARATRAMAGGDVSSYLEHTLASARELDRAGDVRTACVQRNNAGYAQVMLGALSEAEATLREALVTAERMGMVSAAGTARQNLGLALAYGGALQEARAVEERGLEAATQSGDALMTACGYAYLAEILTMGRNYEAAERAAHSALAAAGDTRHDVTALAHAALARVLLVARRLPEAVAAAEKAFLLLPVVTDAGAEASVRLVRAEALHAAGDQAGARDVARVARDRLLERAARIGSPALRKGFLERVPANARTIALAGSWDV